MTPKHEDMAEIIRNHHIQQEQLLSWYDQNHRDLPWRARPKANRPTPAYHVWLSEIMLQQTTVKAVIPYFQKFLQKWPDIQDLANAPLDDVLTAWAGLGYYARARNLHKCAQYVVNELNGTFPTTVNELKQLPGIGPYTASAIASIAFDTPAAAVDGNVERVLTRYLNIKTPIADNKKDLSKHAESLITDIMRPGDFTQALMELGATVCTPKNPSCMLCPWRDSCAAHKHGTASSLPTPKPKKAKPQRYGTVFLIRCKDSQAFLIQKRPEKGLLGGMMEFPSTPWEEIAETNHETIKSLSPKHDGHWSILPEPVVHHFTHFTLHLSVWVTETQKPPKKPEHIWSPHTELDQYALPSVMQKVLKYGLKENKSFL